MSGRRFGSRRAAGQAGRARRDLRLETLERRELLATFTVTNTSDDGLPGSLRYAIAQSNLVGGADKIVFNIAGAGVHTISVSSPLPFITDAVSILGATQPKYIDRPLIELNGKGAGAGANGLRLEAGNVTVDALAINRFSGSGILVESSFDTITRNFLGTNAAGTLPLPNGGPGLRISNGSSNQIGGFDASLGGNSLANLLSGNSGAGLLIDGAASTQNIVIGNYIGTALGGGLGAGNSGDGIVINGGAFNRIGGGGLGQGNVISGNGNNGITILGSAAQSTNILGNFIGVDGNLTGANGGSSGGNYAIPNGAAGIDIQGGASSTFIGGNDPTLMNIISGNKGSGINVEDGPGTQIQGNFIGTDFTGTKNVGNLGAGVAINLGDNSAVGGTLDGAANTIAFNGKTTHAGGVNIQAAQQVRILSNSIFNNFDLGILLQSPAGQPVMNDLGDPDQGPNGLQNYPVLTQVGTAASRTLVEGTLNSMPNTTYLLQFFIGPSRATSNYGQGQFVLGQKQVTTDATGNVDFNVTIPTPSVPGQFVSATATDPLGNTSEFAFDQQVTIANVANLSVAIKPDANPGTLGSDVRYAVTVTDAGPDPATGTKFTMNLPPGLAFKAAENVPAGVTITANGSGNVVSGNLGTIASLKQLTFTIVVTPSLIGQSTVTASVISNEIDSDPSDNAVSQLETIENPADLGLILVSDPTSVTVGNDVSVIAKISNFGPGAATNVLVQITLPSNVSFIGASAGQGTTSFSNGVLTARLGTLANGVTQAVNIKVTAPNTVPASGVLSFTGTVKSDEVEPGGVDPTPNQATLNIPVAPSSDIVLTLVANPEPVLAGSNLTYTYTIVNNGLSPATGVILTDTLPTSVDFVAAPAPTQGALVHGSASVTGGVLTVLVGALDPGVVNTVTGTLVVTPRLPGVVINTATVTLDQPDPDLTNNTVTFTSSISPVDLSVTISVAPDPVEAGKNLTYTVFVTNNGPATATGVTLIDTLPAGVTYISGAASQGNVEQTNGGVTANLGTLTPGASVPVTIVISPPISGQLVNTATVFSKETDVNAANDKATSITFVSPADVGVQLSVSPNTALAGDTITFTAFVTNKGTSAATNLMFTDLLPAGLQLVSATSSQGIAATAGNNVSVPLGTLVPGASATVKIRATPLTDGTYTDSATVSSDQVDPNPKNNTDQATVNVTNGPGTIFFSAPTYTVGENAGQAVITLTRVSGNRGFVTVNFRTTSGTAIAGTNYISTSGTLTFNDGDITKSFTIPVLSDGLVNGATSVGISLSNPTGGATLGASAAATLVIGETDFDVTGPEIVDVQTLGSGKFVTGVTLVFTEALDPARASNPANYSLFAPNKRGGESLVGFQPTYNAANNSVTLTASRALPLNTFFRVVVNGTSSTGVADIFDNRIRGTNGANGQDFVATFARGSALRYLDHDGDLVSLNLSNGGLLDLFRSSNGDGGILRVLGAGSRRSVLTGNVKKGSFNSDGVTSFQSIIGANFGQVDSRLTTPKFFVDEVTAFIKGSRSSVVRTAFVSVPILTASPASMLFARSFGRRFTH